MGDFNNMFYSAGSFNQAVNGWVVTNAASSDDTEKGMAGMFQNAQSFNQDVDSWTPISVKKFENMFNGASRFDGEIFVGTDAATTMEIMFERASSFTGKYAENMATQECTSMKSMFKSATVLNTAVLTSENKWKVETVTTFESMFEGASTFNKPVSTWTFGADAIVIATGFTNMFKNAAAFNSPIFKVAATATTTEQTAVTDLT